MEKLVLSFFKPQEVVTVKKETDGKFVYKKQ